MTGTPAQPDEFSLGFYIHRLDRLPAPADTARVIRGMGGDAVFIKAVNGTLKVNEEQMGAYVAAFRDVGIRVGMWGFIFTKDIFSIPAQMAPTADVFSVWAPDVWLIDAEQVSSVDALWKTSPARFDSAVEYLDALGDLPGCPQTVGLSTYRFISLHGEFPFQQFLTHPVVTLAAPQVYTLGSNNAGEQLQRSKDEYDAIRPLPFYPFGSAYWEHGVEMETEQIVELLETAMAMGLPGTGFWELWFVLQRQEWIDAITATVGGEVPYLLPDEWMVEADKFLRTLGFDAPPLQIHPSILMRVPSSYYLTVRATPAGDRVGSLAPGTMVRVYPPTVPAEYRGTLYNWGRIETPIPGWIATDLCEW